MSGMRPDTCETIGLEFQFHGERVGFARIAFLKLMDLTFDSQQFLYVMPEFVRENIRLCELAGCAEPAAQFIEKTEVNIDSFVLRAIERTSGGRRAAPARAPGAVPRWAQERNTKKCPRMSERNFDAWRLGRVV